MSNEIEGINEADAYVPEFPIPARRGRPPLSSQPATKPHKTTKATQAKEAKAALKRKYAQAPTPVQECIAPYQPPNGAPAVQPAIKINEPPVEWEVKFVFNPQTECMEPRQVRKLARP